MEKDVLFVILYSLMVAGVNLFIQECMKEGMILEKYHDFLDNLWERVKYPKLLKPLGLCIYCYSPYIGAALLYLYGDREPIHYPLLIGMQYVWIELILKLTD